MRTDMRVFRLAAPVVFLAVAALGAPDSDEAKLLPEGAGKELVAKVCFECHGSGNFRKMRADHDGWAEQVADMSDRGAKGTEAEMSAIVDYLAKNFGPDSKVNINTAPLSELKAQLGLSVQECQALIDYREAHGKFQSFEDVAKAGVESAKLQAKKERITF